VNKRFDENRRVLVVDIPMQMKKRGGRRQIIVPERLQSADTQHDYSESLALAITRAHRWKDLIDSGRFPSITKLAEVIGLDVSYTARLYRLTLLAPDIIEAILTGNEPNGLSMRILAQPIPLDWRQQRQLFGFEHSSSSKPHPTT